jgi:rhodanese-related sulfurtransferase
MNRSAIIWAAVAVVAAGVVVALLLSPAPTVRKSIGTAELLKLQAAGASVIDVRTAAEFAGGHIASAINVPVDQIATASASWSKDQPIVVYCATGARSAQAASYLAGAGFRTVYDLSGGLVAWTGQLASGGATAASTVGAGSVKTSGKPIFIEFSTST